MNSSEQTNKQERLQNMLHSLKHVIAGVIIIYVVLVFLTLAFVWSEDAIAIEIAPEARTVQLNSAGEQKTLSVSELMHGQEKFSSSCAKCHLDGGTKTNPNIDLGPERLSLAMPERNSIEGIVDFLNDPTTYDGLQSLSELHPSTAELELFPQMKSLNEEDLSAIAGYILAQPKIVGDQWAGGKPKR